MTNVFDVSVIRQVAALSVTPPAKASPPNIPFSKCGGRLAEDSIFLVSGGKRHTGGGVWGCKRNTIAARNVHEIRRGWRCFSMDKGSLKSVLHER